jgi:hypothetical protein
VDDGNDAPAGPAGTISAISTFTCSAGTPPDGVEPLVCGAIQCVLDAPLDAGAAMLSFSGAFPNPMLGTGVFRFAIPRTGNVRLQLIDQQGRRVVELMNTVLGPGQYTATWDGSIEGGHRAPAGLYMARFEFDGRSITRRVVMLR